MRKALVATVYAVAFFSALAMPSVAPTGLVSVTVKETPPASDARSCE